MRERFGRTSIEFTIGRRDVDDLRCALWRIAELFFAAGARSIMPAVRGLPNETPRRARSAGQGTNDPGAYSFVLSHLFGTARIGGQAAHGEVAPDFSLHGRRSVYVIGSSLFPTNLDVNPQHTIMSIAMHATQLIADA